MNTSRPLSLLPQIRIASPCRMPWDGMDGDDRTRFCRACNLHVHNLSAMTSAEAEALVARTAGQGERLCGVFYQRADGTVLTRDCPVGRAGVKARLRRRAARIAAAFGLVATGAVAAAAPRDQGARLRSLRPFSMLAELIAPAPPPVPGRLVIGAIACPSAQPPRQAPGAPSQQ